MHGRLLLALSLAALGASAVPASAATTIGAPAPLGAPGAPSTCAAPGTGCVTIATTTASGGVAAAPYDGVITSWQVRSFAGGNVRLRTVQPLATPPAGRFTATAHGPAETLTAGATQTFSGQRIPIAQGGRPALEGARGAGALATSSTVHVADVGLSPASAFDDGQTRAGTTGDAQLLVRATLEPDADGDGYGDESQDACPGDAADHAAPCTATRTFGSPLALAPDPVGFSASGNPMDVVQAASAGSVLTAPADGVLTRWRFRASGASASYVLQLLRRSASVDTVVAEAPATAPGAGGAVTALAASVRVRVGDRLAVRSSGDAGSVASVPGDLLGLFSPVLTLGSPARPSGTADASGGSAFRLLAQADVEPDADADGLGDVTQDPCPCVADLSLTGDAPASSVVGEPLVHTYTVRNAGPDRSPGATVALPSGPVDVGALAPGAIKTVTVTVTPQQTGPAATSAKVTGLTRDPVAANDAASASTLVTPPSVAPPPVQFAILPCTNVIRGTRDDDALRGTDFGDRIVGLDGKDYEKGGGAADCLEGGDGGDVLDGQDGDDRVSGGQGSDRLMGGTGNDRLTGSAGNDRLVGGPGNDSLLPGTGRDAVIAGSGNDTVSARDKVRETIDCGPGKDTVRADRVDRLKGCEKVTRR